MGLSEEHIAAFGFSENHFAVLASIFAFATPEDLANYSPELKAKLYAADAKMKKIKAAVDIHAEFKAEAAEAKRKRQKLEMKELKSRTKAAKKARKAMVAKANALAKLNEPCATQKKRKRDEDQ